MPCRNPACRCCQPDPCEGRNVAVRIAPECPGAAPITRRFWLPGSYPEALAWAQRTVAEGFWWNETDSLVRVVGPGRVLDVTLGG